MAKKQPDLFEDDLENILYKPYSDEELQITPELEQQIEKLVKFFDQYGISYKIKKSYPNYDEYIALKNPHDVNKWLNAVKNIYSFEQNGLDRINSIRQVVAGWNVNEINDFLNWLKYYQEGTHLKYKYAQLWFEGGSPGYFLKVKKDENSAISEPAVTVMPEPKPDNKEIIERQRNKIIGRLDSAEKLLRSYEGQLFAGKEYEALMEILYQLKKKIQLVNKLSSSNKTYEDMIIREANKLNKFGFNKASSFLYKISQEIPNPNPPAPPTESSGNVSGLPSMGPGMPQNPPESAPNENSEVPLGISKFLENLQTNSITTINNKNEITDNLEVEDNIIVEAQTVIPSTPTLPETTTTTPVTAPVTAPTTTPTEEIEVKEEDLLSPKDKTISDFDDKVNDLMANLSVQDIIYKLENLAKIFKVREVPRQLAIVDMMLDSIGLASYFPSLAEAQNKALESNNYISTRVDDILSKLQGALKGSAIDLKGENIKETPEVTAIKSKLQSDQAKELAKKELRRQEISTKSEVKETPEIEVVEGLTPAQPKVTTI